MIPAYQARQTSCRFTNLVFDAALPFEHSKKKENLISKKEENPGLNLKAEEEALVSLSKSLRDICINDPEWTGVFIGNNTKSQFDSLINVLQFKSSIPKNKLNSKVKPKSFFIKLADESFSQLKLEKIKKNMKIELRSSFSTLLAFRVNKENKFGLKFLQSGEKINGLLIKVKAQAFAFSNSSHCKAVTRRVKGIENDVELMAKTRRYICVSFCNKNYIIQVVCVTKYSKHLQNYFQSKMQLMNLSNYLRSMPVFNITGPYKSVSKLVANHQSLLYKQLKDHTECAFEWKKFDHPNLGEVVLAQAVDFSMMKLNEMEALKVVEKKEKKRKPTHF